MVEAVRDATVLTATEADVDDYTYFPVFHNLRMRRDHYDVATVRPLDDKAREILDAIDDFTRGRPERWGGVYFALHNGDTEPAEVKVRNPLTSPNGDSRGLVLFANVGSEPLMVGQDPRLRDEGLVLLRSEQSDGPPRVLEAVVDSFDDWTFNVCGFIRAALTTKSQKTTNWHEMFGGIKINASESNVDTVYLDLDFDYGS